MPVFSPATPVEFVTPVPPPGQSPRPDRRAAVLAGAALLAVGIAGGVVVGRQFASSATAENSTPAELEKPGEPGGDTVRFSRDKQSAAGIECVTVTPEPLVAHLWRPGRVALRDDRLAHICPRAEGIVRDVRVSLGQTVAAGDVLAVVDCRELGMAKLDLYKARIGLAAEQEVAARTRTTMANAGELLRLLAADTPLDAIERAMADKPIGDWRQQVLGASTQRQQLKALLASQKSSGGAIPESSVLKTQADADAANALYTSLTEELKFQVKNQVRQAELKLKDAETAVAVARSRLLMLGLAAEEVDRTDPIAEGATASDMPVKAPFAGTVLEKHAVRSERVGPTTQMFALADLSSVWVKADVFEADLPLLRSLDGRSVVFRAPVAGLPEQAVTVVSTGDLIDNASRSLTLTALADNAGRLLKPGMFVEVGFDTGDRTPALQIPSSAVLRHGDESFVFVRVADDLFRRTEVALGRTAGERVEVTRGISAGDRVVAGGGFVLKSELLKDQMAGE